MKQTELKHVRICTKCHGAGEIMGAVMRIFCPMCHGNRFVSVEEGSPISVRGLCEELYQARKQLASTISQLERAPLTTGPENTYYGNNGRGVGGSNFTGD